MLVDPQSALAGVTYSANVGCQENSGPYYACAPEGFEGEVDLGDHIYIGGYWVNPTTLVFLPPSGPGAMTISGGPYYSGEIYVGYLTPGTLTIGNANLAITVVVGAGAPGTLTVSNSTVTFYDLGLGSGGNATITGSNISIQDSFSVESGAGANSSLTFLNSTIDILPYFNVDIGGYGLANSSGSLVLDGGSMTIGNNAGTMIIGGGSTGIGTVDVNGGALTMTGANSYLAVGGGGKGSLTVENSGTLNVASLAVGNVAGPTDMMTVSSGGMVSVGSLQIGVSADSTGTLTVTNGMVTVTGNTAYIGLQGTGTLTLNPGGSLSLTANGGAIGVGQGSTGIGIVDVNGGALNLTGANSYLAVGNNGTGTLTVENGGSVNVTGLSIGTEGGSTGTLTVSSGGSVTVGSLTVGNQAGSMGTATLTGGQLTVTQTSGVNIGSLGTGSLTLNPGGQLGVTAATGSMGIGQGITGIGSVNVNGGVLNLSGANSTLAVGNGGTGSLAVGNSGTLSVANLQVGELAGPSASGPTGTMAVGSGGMVNAETLSIGGQVGSNGEVMVADGQITVAQNATIGYLGTATLTVNPGGHLIITSASGSAAIGQGITGDGMVNVNGGLLDLSGANSTLAVGNGGTGGLTIGNSGTLNVANLQVGELAGPSASTGPSGTLGVGSGGMVNSQTFVIGDQAGSSGATTVGNGQITAAQYATIGNLGTGTLTLSAGGQLNITGNASSLDVGGGISGIGTVTVGAGQSSITVNGNLTVGDSGAGTLNLTPNGTVTAESLVVGNQPTGSGTVSVSAGVLNISDGVTIGNGGQGNLKVNLGGELNITSANGSMSIGENAGMNLVTVDGGSLNLPGTNSALAVGDAGSGTLVIENGGTLNVGLLAIANQPGSTGLVSLDSATASLTAAYINVGTAGTGTLTVQNGATVTTPTFVVGALPGSIGYASVTNGQINANQAASIGNAGTGTLTLNSFGYLNISAENGTLSVGQASSGIGTLDVDGGTLNLSGSGSYLAVGNGGTGFLTVEPSGTVNTVTFVVGSLSGSHGNVTMTGGEISVSGALVIGRQAGSVGTFDLTGGTLTAGTEVIGKSGSGAFIQNGGNNSSAGLFIGSANGSNGTYSQEAGSNTVNGNLALAPGTIAVGEFDQSGGTNIVKGNLTFAGAAGDGTYVLSGGQLIVTGSVMTGSSGSGTFNLDGGTLVVGGGSIALTSFNVGMGSGSNGEFALGPSEALTTQSEVIGWNGVGLFTQGAGTNTVESSLTLAQNSGSTGTYVLEGGRLSAGSIQVNTNGIFKFNGGVASFGSFNLDGGAVTAAGDEILDAVGQSSASYSFSQVSGINSVNGTLVMGSVAAHSGTYNLGGGSVSANSEVVGSSGAGHFVQSGGTNTVVSGLTLGAHPGSSGAYSLQGGTLSAGTEAIGGAGICTALSGTGCTASVPGGMGSMTQNGGVNRTGSLTIGAVTYGSPDTYTLRSGTLLAGNYQVNANGSFIQNGGSATVSGNTANSGSISVNANTFQTLGTFANAGKVTIGSGATVSAGTYTQTSGATLLNNGTLDPTAITINGGTFGGTGTVVGNVTVNGATLVTGPAPGALHFVGSFAQTAGAVDFAIGSNGAGGFVTSGLVFDPGNSVTVNGARIVFDFTSGAQPSGYLAAGSFNIGNFFLSRDGSGFASTFGLGSVFKNDSFAYDINGGPQINLALNSSTGNLGISTAVPEPPSLALMLAGLSLIGLAASRRRMRLRYARAA